MNAKEYAQFEARFRTFMEREGINNLSSDDDEGSFSWYRCECCKTDLGGTRYAATGWNGTEVCTYRVCPDCLYYAAYGQLDDETMQDIGRETDCSGCYKPESTCKRDHIGCPGVA